MSPDLMLLSYTHYSDQFKIEIKMDNLVCYPTIKQQIKSVMGGSGIVSMTLFPKSIWEQFASHDIFENFLYNLDLCSGISP